MLRAERGLTLRDASRLTGVTQETLSDLERGRRHPHDVTLAKIANGYGVPVEDLIAEEPVPPKGEALRESGPEDPGKRSYERLREDLRQRDAGELLRLTLAAYNVIETDEWLGEDEEDAVTSEELRELNLLEHVHGVDTREVLSVLLEEFEVLKRKAERELDKALARHAAEKASEADETA